jgi:hypothetical protein
MSKVAKHCSSCPAAPAHVAPAPVAPAAHAPAPSAENASPKKGSKIEFVLEDVLGQVSDGVIKVKQFKKFLGLDVQRLNMTGELLTYTHRNGPLHMKMQITFQDKKEKDKVNYIELDFISHKKNKENKNTVGVDGSSKCLCIMYEGQCLCGANGVVTTTTYPKERSYKSNEMLQEGRSVLQEGRSAEITFYSGGRCRVSLKPKQTV